MIFTGRQLTVKFIVWTAKYVKLKSWNGKTLMSKRRIYRARWKWNKECETIVCTLSQYSVAAVVSCFYFIIVAAVIVLGLVALFLLFVLLYSERVASHSCETLRELLHHPFKLYPLFNLSRKWKRWLPKILTKDKSSILKYFMSFLTKKESRWKQNQTKVYLPRSWYHQIHSPSWTTRTDQVPTL